MSSQVDDSGLGDDLRRILDGLPDGGWTPSTPGRRGRSGLWEEA